MSDALTSYGVGRLLAVSPAVVYGWHAAGLLRGYRMPGSRHRRFRARDVYKFARRHGWPVAAAFAGGADNDKGEGR